MASDENVLFIVEKVPRVKGTGVFIRSRFRVFRTRDAAYAAADTWENKSRLYRYVVRRATWGPE